MSKSHRNNLHADRQIKHLRRIVNSDYCDSAIRDSLREQSYEPYGKVGNAALVWQGRLYWAVESKVLWLAVDELSIGP
jgi:hypothetical protein